MIRPQLPRIGEAVEIVLRQPDAERERRDLFDTERVRRDEDFEVGRLLSR